MEIFLQWYDDLDDLVGVVRFGWSRIVGFLLALAAFVATGIACVLMPKVFVAVLATLLSIVLVEFIRQRRLLPPTD